MKRVATILLCSFLLMLTALTYGQDNAPVLQSKVVMSEADINSLVKTLMKHRAAQSQKVQSLAPAVYYPGYSGEILVKDVSLENTLLKLHLTLLQEQIMNRSPVVQGQVYNVLPDKSGDDSQRIRDMQYEISRLQSQLRELSNTKSTAPATLLSTGQSAQRENIVVTPVPLNEDREDEENALTNMQQKMDSLLTVIQSNSEIKTPEAISYSNEFDSLQQELAALKEEMIVRKEMPTDYDLLREQFADYQKDVYFANNSAELDANGAQIVEELKGLLAMNNNLDVVLKGFASNKGGPAYNEKLSMQRAETIKKMLTQEGIHPTRILTQYHGIDYNASSDSQARRVVVSLIVRK